MAGQSTKLHVSGYRFLLRRMEHALVRGDVRMHDDPLRAQSLSLTSGALLAAIIVAACAVLAFLRPPGALGSAAIVVVRDTGALYVRVGDTVHPVLNLASARLIAGTPASPQAVSPSAVENAKRGPMVGIPGAPANIPPPLGQDASGWTVCDDATNTTVFAGRLPGDGLSTGRSVLVTPRSESAAINYLLYDGRRAKVDLRNRALVRALKLDAVAPQPVSRTLLDAMPEAPPIVAPQIPDAGSPSPLHGLPVGSVLRVVRAAEDEYYVTLAQGVQRISQVVADLIRFNDSQHGRDIATVAPDVIGAVPNVDTLAVSSFPARGGASSAAVVCAQWQLGSAGPNSAVLVGDSQPDRGDTMTLAQADGDGPGVDAFAMPSGRSAFVRSTGLAGDGAGVLYFVNDSGVVFGLRDKGTAEHLGLDGTPVPALWPILARLPRGPELSKDAASIARDSVAGPS
jgi:type VII secretion protein EccB